MFTINGINDDHARHAWLMMHTIIIGDKYIPAVSVACCEVIRVPDASSAIHQ